MRSECSRDEVFEKFGWSVTNSEYSRSESVEMVWHVDRMDEYPMARRVLMAYGLDGWHRGFFWQQRDDCGGCATMCERRNEWRALVHMEMIKFRPFLHGLVFFWIVLPRSGGLSPVEGWIITGTEYEVITGK